MINTLLIHTMLATRPLLGPVNCSFTIGCTSYAIIQLKHKSLLPALWLIAKRLLACCSLL